MGLWKPLLLLTVFLSMEVNKFHNVEDGEKTNLSVVTLLKFYLILILVISVELFPCVLQAVLI